MGYDGPNYTQTPNLFLDEHLPDMGCAETKVVLAVIRQTFGWHKRKDRLSISQLMEITGLSNRAVIDGTKQAMERGVIDRQKKGSSYEYWLVVDGEDTSQGESQGVNNSHTPYEDRSQEGVKNPHTQKKAKKTNQKKESTPAHEDPVDVLVDLWDVRPTAYQKDRIRQVVDDVDEWLELLDRFKMQNKDSKKAIGWAVEDYQDRPTGDGDPASKYAPSPDPDL